MFLPYFALQPSEFAKVAIVLILAVILSEKRDAEAEPRDRDVALALGLAAIPIGLVLLQNDTGTVPAHRAQRRPDRTTGRIERRAAIPR